MIRRLRKELAEMEKEPVPNVEAHPIDPAAMAEWVATITGPDDSPFEGGRFNLRLTFPSDYPFKPPKIMFTTKIYHPNVSEQGHICLDLLNTAWNPVLTVAKLLLSVCSLLTDPNPEHGLNQPVLQQYRADKAAYNKSAREWTLKYATPSAATADGATGATTAAAKK